MNPNVTRKRQLSICLLAWGSIASATSSADAEGSIPYQPFSIGAEAGTPGIGGSASWRFADHLGVVAGVDYFDYSLTRTISGIPYTGSLHFMSERAGLNVFPWSNHSFCVSLGTYFNQDHFKGSALSDGSLTINGAPVPAGTSVNLEYKPQPINPYASIGGNLYFDKARHFSLGGELGAFYLGQPRVTVSTTPPGAVDQGDLDAYRDKVVNDIKKVPVWPILKISFNYSF
jgi:hypothetical protein